MAGKPKLYYFNMRGRMESIRWLLAAAGIEVCVLGFHSQVQKLQMVEAEQLCTSLNTGYRGSIVGEKCAFSCEKF